MFKPHQKSFLFLIVLWFALVFFSIVNLLNRPALPYPLTESKKSHRCSITLPNGQTLPIASINGIKVPNKAIARMVVETGKIGQTITLKTMNGCLLSLPLIPANTLTDILSNLLPGLFFLLVGLWIRRSKPYPPESYFIWAAYLFGFIIAVSWDGIGHHWFGWPVLLTYYFSYPMAFAVFLVYSFYFPQPMLAEPTLRKIKIVLLTLGFFIAIGLTVLGMRRFFVASASSFFAYHQFYRLFRLFTMALILIAFYNMLLNSRTTPNRVSRLRFYWVAGGIVLGSFPFIFLWSLPQIFNMEPLIPEWFSDLALIIVPLSVAIAILKYRLFDIEIVLSRSVTYLISVSLILLVYAFIVGSLSWLITQNVSFRSPYLSALAAIVVGLAFNPMRSRVQSWVDQRLFHIRYNQFKALQRFLDHLPQCSTIEQVGNLLEQSLQNVLPLAYNQFLPQNRLPSFLKKVSLPCKAGKVCWFVNESHSTYFENLPGQKIDLPQNIAAVVNLGDKCYWLLGKKQSALRFWREDLELITEFARSALVTIEKLQLMEQALKEAAEKEAARQLSAWKSLMVSEVAHNFNGPLNSLIWKLETLPAPSAERQQPFEQKKSELRQQIDRLQHMVRRLLNLAALESGQLVVQPQPLLLRDLVQKVVDALQWQITEKQMQMDLQIPENVQISADPVLAEGIVQNIVENALKYAPPHSTVTLTFQSTQRNNKPYALLTICDQGPGIPPQERQQIFTPFAGKNRQKGLHLGLYMARQFARAMDGDVHIASATQQTGTCVEIFFPLILSS